jgi:excisionase family DNA binding protein
LRSPAINPGRLLTRAEAADRLGLQEQTLAVWATTKRYNLPFLKLGRAVRYRPADIEAWLDRQTVRAEEGAR